MATGRGAVNHPGVEIIDVWASNLESEFFVIREIVDDFPYIALDTEFPGVVATPAGTYDDPADHNYESIRSNVDILHLIQLGLAFFDASGNLPISPASGRPVVWQFNFREFDVYRDLQFTESIELLRRSGMKFGENRERGVDAKLFGELIMSSGAVLNDSVQWVVFHGTFDFGYLLKILTCKPLPKKREGFFKILRVFFPVLYDIKYVIRDNDYLVGGLNSIANKLNVLRLGASHQAGSDCLVTAWVFVEIQRLGYVRIVDRLSGFVFGLDTDTARSIIRYMAKPLY